MDLDRLKANVFPGESGGDYNALFGYSNRPGRQFEGVNLTDMTIDEALQFANPSGPYGQWVKGQVGRVATPMGAYQVVGSTLRAAKEGLGLTGSERMTPETQDRIGQWIYQTQGPGAWEAWGKGGNMQPQGLLGTMSTRNAEEPRQPFYRNPDFWDTLAIGLQGMTLNPNQALIGALQERMGARREERQTAAQRNATAAWLESQGLTQLAEGVRSGAITGAEALAMARGQQQDPTAAQRNYEFLISQGVPQEQALQRAFSGGTTINMPGAPTIGTIPPGYQAVQDPQTGGYRFEAIPGGPAAAQVATAEEQRQAAAATASDSIRLIDSVLNDPKLASVTGMVQGRLPAMTQAGTDLVTKIDQIQGQAFLQAFESLKGGGAITEREGIAAQNAIANLNRAQSEAAFKESLKILRSIIDRGRRRAAGENVPEEIGGSGVTVGDPY